ncbi:MAG: hypothetical protein OQK98_11340 [Gammaproteobacteria bacterium]|nr:hypothetical protein [Gammaproteobacteria bacterium]
MNRTFLIILMVGTAMMIAVIGQHEPTSQLDTMPWEVDQLDNGSLRVFDLTLAKTSIQDANQIFARFAETKLQVTTDSSGNQTYQLIAIYDELIIGSLIAQIKLNYQIETEELRKIYLSLNKDSSDKESSEGLINNITLYPVSKEIEIEHLNKPVSSITYIPSVDYGEDTIRQNFGPAAEEKQLNDDLQLWFYPEMGLKIYISQSKPDEFVYAPQIKQKTPQSQP